MMATAASHSRQMVNSADLCQVKNGVEWLAAPVSEEPIHRNEVQLPTRHICELDEHRSMLSVAPPSLLTWKLQPPQ